MPKPKPQDYVSLTIDLAKDLAKTMVRVADMYPLNFLTERDFYPLVHTYLAERLPEVRSEHSIKDGDIDFRTGGYNPSMLELAVAPREFVDRNRPSLVIPGFKSATQLYASVNRSELRKLFSVENTVARNRYLFLIDLRGLETSQHIEEIYKKEAKKITDKKGAVSIIFANHNECERILLHK